MVGCFFDIKMTILISKNQPVEQITPSESNTANGTE